MQEKPLWDKVQNFTFENLEDEYDFTTRLAYENNWTEYFTKQAIEEYKKFMYLAAISNQMVSPSEIIDTVWHQHLIYTTSYKQFCVVLNKNIEHIPSTHNKQDKEKFIKAKKITQQLYEAEFGNQPKELWEYSDALESIKLKTSKETFSTINTMITMVFIVFFIPSCSALYPVLQQIENPFFLIGYIPAFIILLTSLYFLLLYKNEQLLKEITPNLVLDNLTPYELISLRRGHVYIIHTIVNDLIETQQIEVTNDYKLNLLTTTLTQDKHKNCIIKTLMDSEPIFYTQLVQMVVDKPIFSQYKYSLDKLSSNLKQTKYILKFNAITTILLGVFFVIGLSRFWIGLFNYRPIGFLFFVLVIQAIASIYFIIKSRNSFFPDTLIQYYKNLKLRPAIHREWNRALSDKMLLATSFIALVNRVDNARADGSSCGSNCGSSDSGGGSDGGCGGGCGGCGGGD